jgi:hypothetical protein
MRSLFGLVAVCAMSVGLLTGCSSTPSCPEGSVTQELAAGDDAQALLVESLLACAYPDGTGTIVNGSKVVWTFTEQTGTVTSQFLGPADIGAFHQLVESDGDYREFMTPNEEVSISSWNTAQFAPDQDLSGRWVIYKAAIKQIEDVDLDPIGEISTEGSPVRKAVWDCAKAGGSILASVASSDDASAEDLVENTGNTFECAESWKGARAARNLPEWRAIEAESAPISSAFDDALKAAVKACQKICHVGRLP